MRILLYNNKSQRGYYEPLAKEVGLELSEALLILEAEIAERGIKKDGHYMIARDDKGLKTIFPWCGTAKAKKILASLEEKQLIFISDNTLFQNDALWYGLNWDKIKTLKSIVVMTELEIEESHAAPVAVAAKKGAGDDNGHRNGDGKPVIFHVIFGAVLKICHWDKTPKLSNADRLEVGGLVKNLLHLYPKHDIEPLRLMVLGFETYRVEVLKLTGSAPRPGKVWSMWQGYSEYCTNFLDKKPPQVREDWL